MFSQKGSAILRAAIKNGNYGGELMSARSFRGTVRRTMLQYNYPKSNLLFIEEKPKSNLYSSNIRNVQEKNVGSTAAQNFVRLICPSEWARLDIASSHCYQQVYRGRTDDASPFDIEYSSILRDRHT